MRKHLRKISLILILASFLFIGCKGTTPINESTVEPSTPPSVSQTEEWKTYNNNSLGISFKYLSNYRLLLDAPFSSGIQLESDSAKVIILAQPVDDRDISDISSRYCNRGCQKSKSIIIQKGNWQGLYFTGNAVSDGLNLEEVVYIVKSPSNSLLTILAVSTSTKLPINSDIEFIWQSLSLTSDRFSQQSYSRGSGDMVVLQLPDNDYSLQYPNTWLAQVQRWGSVWITDPNNTNAFILSVDSLKPTEANLDNTATAAVNSLFTFKNVKVLSKDKFTVTGAKDAVLLSGTATLEDGRDGVFRILLVQTTNKIYQVEMIAKAAEWKYIEPDFNAIVRSFTLKP